MFPHDLVCMYEMEGERRSCPSDGDPDRCERVKESHGPIARAISEELEKNRKPYVRFVTLGSIGRKFP